MKNAIKFTIIVLFGSLLAFLPKECNPHGEGEMEYLGSTHQVEIVAPNTFEA